MATKIKKVVGYTGGRESAVSGLGTFLLILGVVGFAGCIIVSGLVTRQTSHDKWAEHGVSWFWIVIGTGALVEGIVVFIIFNALADVLRIVKKIAGIPYGGDIDGRAKPHEGFVCSECGRNLIEEVPPDWEPGQVLRVGQRITSCPHCKAVFETEE